MGAGRPVKLNDEVQRKIVDAISGGNYMDTASAYAGISKDTFYRWLRRGEREKQRVAKNPRAKIKKEEKMYVELSDEVEKALAKSEMRDVYIIGKAAESQWQAAAWRLERKFPKKWGRKNFLPENVETIDQKIVFKEDVPKHD